MRQVGLSSSTSGGIFGCFAEYFFGMFFFFLPPFLFSGSAESCGWMVLFHSPRVGDKMLFWGWGGKKEEENKGCKHAARGVGCILICSPARWDYRSVDLSTERT